MSIVFEPRVDLAALLSPCSQFSGQWPDKLEFYPPYWWPRLKEGRGIGRDQNYLPWLKVRDVPSRGTSHIIAGVRARRSPYHLLSDYEAVYFYLVERRRSTKWICEAWPILDLAETLRLCAKFNVRHPYRRGFPDAFTVDFLIGEWGGGNGDMRLRATAIKSPEDAEDPSVLQTLSVQHAWCQMHGVPWALADMSGIRDIKTTLGSLLFIRWWFRIGARPPAKAQAARFARVFLDNYERNVILTELIARTAQTLRIRRDRAEDLFRYTAWWSDIPVDVQTEIQLNYPLVLRPCAN